MQQIRDARLPLGWALWRLARQTITTARFLSQVEAWEVVPDVASSTLTALGAALEAGGVELLRNDEGLQVRRRQ